MLIKVGTISRTWNISPKGVLHVGAHKAEESQAYKKQMWGHVYWIEANPTLYSNLKNVLDAQSNTVFNCAGWDIDGQNLIFHETSDSQSSSLLPLKSHSIHYPNIVESKSYEVTTRTMNSLFPNTPPFTIANLDVQGAELHVLKGMDNFLGSLEAIYTEVNKEELYENCARVEDIDEYLKKFGFRRVATRWIPRKGWGDALYLNTQIVQINQLSVFLNQVQLIIFELNLSIVPFILNSTHLMFLARRLKRVYKQIID